MSGVSIPCRARWNPHAFCLDLERPLGRAAMLHMGGLWTVYEILDDGQNLATFGGRSNSATLI
jgi:hypothetical protein